MGSERRKVVLASRNPDKVRELAQLLSDLPFEVVSAADYPDLPEVIEDGTTIEGNAARKAVVTAGYTGEIAVADDTSLQVRELNGLPDIFAARFSGPEATYESNAALVLELLRDVPESGRQARFATACAWVDPRPVVTARDAAPPTGGSWLANPWARAIEVADPARQWEFWNGFWDLRAEWARYRADLLADLADYRRHDRAGLARVAAGLLADCPEACGQAVKDSGAVRPLRLPDPRIWALLTPDPGQEPPTLVAPSGLDRAAPGRGVGGPVWLSITAVGKLLGTITSQPIGAGGFGYDPIFRPAGRNETLAELEPADKNALSHRGTALRRLLRSVRAAYFPE
jgi:non-canonical purine NTP pyrophosphatase (RdgB/HAM1 family)